MQRTYFWQDGYPPPDCYAVLWSCRGVLLPVPERLTTLSSADTRTKMPSIGGVMPWELEGSEGASEETGGGSGMRRLQLHHRQEEEEEEEEEFGPGVADMAALPPRCMPRKGCIRRGRQWCRPAGSRARRCAVPAASRRGLQLDHGRWRWRRRRRRWC